MRGSPTARASSARSPRESWRMCPDDRSEEMLRAPWDHPDWYDLHDTTWTAGPEREPEHYRELVIALPPVDAQDHLVDVGAGTGKLSGLIARGYPKLGRVTLIEPNR